MASTQPAAGLGGIGSQPAAATTPTSSALLGKDDFLKLLMTQLQHQDPLNPVDDKEFLGQMAQFSTLEQITNVGNGVQGLASATQVSQALSLVGHSVEYDRADGSSTTGAIDSVSFAEGHIDVHVGADTVAPSAIRSVR